MKFTTRASLALWKRRLKYCQGRVELWRKRAHSKGGPWGTRVTADEAAPIHKWERLAASAQSWVAKRQKQLADSEPLRLKALDVARGQLGVMETGGNNRGVPLSRYIRSNGGTGPEPWCGDFMAFCYRIAGSKVVQRGWAAVRLLGFLTGMRVVGVRSLLSGMIVTFTFDHTGMFVEYCDSRGHPMAASRATHIKTIEGNTGPSGAVSDSSTGGDGVYEKIRAIGLVARGVEVLR